MSNVYGNIKGLKPNQMRRLEKIYQRRIPPKEIVTQDFARLMTELSHEIGRQIGVLVNRRGQIEYVIVGDAKKIELPDFKRVRAGEERFRGLRCLHTHLYNEPLTQDDLTDLALLRLDLMAAIEVDSKTGLPGLVKAAHLMPIDESDDLLANSQNSNWAFLDPRPPYELTEDFLVLIESLEEEFARRSASQKKMAGKDGAILVGVTTDGLAEAQDSMDELKELARSSGIVILDSILQRRHELDPKYLIGKGKLEEVVIRSMRLGANMIVFDKDLSPAQVRLINEATDLKIIDRSQLILDIFAQQAATSEGKIQVELAQLKYLLPRLTGKGTEMSRLMGGIGGRGPGETKLEVDRRRVRERIKMLEQQLDKIRTARQARRAKRTRKGLPVISIVGYTNAGKSTLLNTLTNSDVLAEERMFATLDPRSRLLRLPRLQEVVINDTVGFIRDLPETLLAAFKATLEEMEDSDLLVHLVDAANPRYLNQIASVEKILLELELNNLPRILVFNKCDLVAVKEVENLCRLHNAIAIVASQKQSLEALLEKIDQQLGKLSLSSNSLLNDSSSDVGIIFSDMIN
ncbi:MAG: GTPase HflX [Blastocatellia bacterium]|nr:GTPase HflX [Blastocatellia bacterium]MBN8724464.1 GTPase HflX [Acidobacteriota bacterium]